MKPTAVPKELLEAPRRQFTVDEYHRMIDAGVFDEDDHSELLHGVLIARSPQGGPHARVIQRLNGLLVRGLGEAYDVRVQLPLTLRRDDSEPEPDFSVVPHGHCSARRRGLPIQLAVRPHRQGSDLRPGRRS